MSLRSLLVAAALFGAAVPALATPQLRNGSDMWYDPAESGWGMNIFHQGDTLFVSLFVYGPDGQPRWYTASSLVGGDDGPLHDRPQVFGGALYETTGPWFGGTFDPAGVTVRQVGTMNVDLGNNITVVDYSIDGVHVTKQVHPFTFRNVNLTGQYVGNLYQPAASGAPEVIDSMLMSIQDDGTSLHMATSSEHSGSCTFDGTRSANGQIALASGTYHDPCAGRSGPYSMAVDMTPDGFTGFFLGDGINSFEGRVAASRRNAGLHEGNGWRTDNWFVPNEPGWGVNIVEQGDTIFATLFVYDAQRRPRWYVASALRRSGPTASGTYVFSGPLHQTSGSWFGATFNPSAVTLRQVGTMSFEVRGTNATSTATLAYNVDGASVSKTVTRNPFRKNNLSGRYVGNLAASADNPGGASYEHVAITIDDSDAGFVMQTVAQGPTQFPSGAGCTYTAPPNQQSGEQRLVAGTYTCQGGRTGSFEMRNVFGTFNGFNAGFQGAWVVNGHMEGVRLGVN